MASRNSTQRKARAEEIELVPFEEFKEGLRRLVSVPKEEIDARIVREEEKNGEEKSRKNGEHKK